MNNVLEIMMSVGIFSIGRQFIRTLDEEFAAVAGKKKTAAVVAMICLIIAAFIDLEVPLLCSMFWGPLFLAAYCDYCTTYIYDFVYIPAAIAGVGAMIINGDVVTVGSVVELLLFILLQFLLFKHFYGASDSIAFSVCAAWLTSFGDGIREYLIFMIVAYVIHIAVQLWKKNIDKRGRLKEPKALIPYIAVAMLVIQLYR